MNFFRSVACLLVVLWVAPGYAEEVIKDQVVKLGQESSLFASTQYDKYITRGNFCSLILDDFLFSETQPGRFIVDLTVTMNSASGKPLLMRVLLDDLIEVKSNNEVTTHKLSNTVIARQLSLVDVSDIDISARLIPIANDKLPDFSPVIAPLLGKAFYGIDIQYIGKALDEFIKLARKGDDKDSLLFKANIPVSQNIIEATKLDNKDGGRPPLYNNRKYAIVNDASKSVSDDSLSSKARDLLNGIWIYATGKTLTSRPKADYKSFISLRFSKDENQVLPDTIIAQLKELSFASQKALTDDTFRQMEIKAMDADKAIDALLRAKQIDPRAEFHLRNYVELMRIWGAYRRAGTGGDKLLKENNNWQVSFRDWFNQQRNMGKLYFTQSFSVEDLYSENKIAKIFVPYSLSDEMTVESVYRQITLHQSLKNLGEAGCSLKNDGA